LYANTPQLMCILRTFAAAERALGRTEFFSGDRRSTCDGLLASDAALVPAGLRSLDQAQRPLLESPAGMNRFAAPHI